MDFKILIPIFCVLIITHSSPITEEEARARSFLENLNDEFNRQRNIVTEAEWAYASNITDANLVLKNEAAAKAALFAKSKAQEVLAFNFKDFADEDLKRQLKKMSHLDDFVLSEEKYAELLDVVSAMQSNYAKVKICEYGDSESKRCDLALEPEITEKFSRSRDANELKYYWTMWYNLAGTPVKDKFLRYSELVNEAAKLNNFTSQAEAWLDEYEDPTFEEQLNDIFLKFRPFYLQIHAYVRYRLREHYGADVVAHDKPIPMHLLGNVWAQTWDEIVDITTPFPNKKLLDVTEEMVKQGYTPLKMFQLADEFFQSLNMSAVPPTFWEKSIIEKPTDGRDLVCHASAWDFYKKDDVRIKQCTRVNMDFFFTTHHELGHIQYYLQYQNLPSVYREGANPGFHEAVGDVLSLSVSSPKHLQSVGLLKDYVEDEEAKINKFYRAGLTKLVFLPFAYTIDKYRWGIFRGDIKSNEYNCKFWQMREEFSGIEPPVVRSENDFDATAKYHVSADVEYLRYLVSYIVQFQFHKAACIKAGQYIPGDPEKTLIDCDIYKSTEAGNAFKAMLSLGSSKPWPDAMEVLTGQRKMDIGPLLEYFEPLRVWLEKENQRLGAHVGWDKSDKCVS